LSVSVRLSVYAVTAHHWAMKDLSGVFVTFRA
jgi:hypothetical protein